MSKGYVDGNLHVVPTDDVFDHWENGSCPCQPVLEQRDATGPYATPILIHNLLKEMPQ